ncbi:ribosome small subunit-dependent GTPase A [Occallatibacter riparius]|uniref:Small ribosomal subunit biogenesis GTPase RsgA n=1 Tax=Occallatibacter riparius TaxID=1002689 RepID=A0A9J7BHB5_9BACT|nr:ribosome small subunit-dependent GTPase A [Occallatibacter riparius]UWZ82184.1 ribosome small subunit-dependent GTPase A [Occallatibacter riparius]
MNLEQLGWSDFFARQCATGIPARVAFACREQFIVWTESGEVDTEPSGALRHASQLWPAVGDWVMLRDDGPVIDRVLERRTTLSRKQPGSESSEQVLAANVDVLFIVSGLDHDYNPRRLERYLVVARESGATPVIVLNKADLAGELGFDLEELLRLTRTLAGGTTVLPLSAMTDASLDVLGATMSPGETAAMVGSSGVGKSTILNRLLGAERRRTMAVGASDDRGRHTTTARELFVMPGGWLLIDMPGLREVGLWSAEQSVDAGFGDIQELAAACRFRDCTHSGEPGCAVADGAVDQARLANYQKMRREVEYLKRKADPELARQTRAKWKAIEKSVRRHPKW